MESRAIGPYNEEPNARCTSRLFKVIVQVQYSYSGSDEHRCRFMLGPNGIDFQMHNVDIQCILYMVEVTLGCLII